MPIKKVIDPIYGIKVTFIFMEEDSAVVSYMHKKIGDWVKYENLLYSSGGFLLQTDDSSFYLVLPVNCPSWHESIVHECMHITSMALRERGFRLTDASEEAFAYYIGWLASKLTNIYIKETGEGKKISMRK